MNSNQSQMKAKIFIIFSLFVLLSYSSFAQSKAEKLGWKLGVQAWTFRNFSFSEALDKIKQLGLHYVEGYPGQKIGAGIEGGLDFNMTPEKIKQVLDLLHKKGIKMVSYGVVNIKSREEWEQIFLFAKTMGLENIVAEPKPEDLAYISLLCDKYKVNIAIHNHPQPSHYWHPDTLLTALKLATSSRVGSCSDVGHWRRSGLNAVESLKKLQGHIIEVHLKDVIDAKDPSEETIWGKGGNDMKAVFTELNRQHFKGMMSIEYESNPADNMSEISQSINFFNTLIAGF